MCYDCTCIIVSLCNAIEIYVLNTDTHFLSVCQVVAMHVCLSLFYGQFVLDVLFICLPVRPGAHCKKETKSANLQCLCLDKMSPRWPKGCGSISGYFNRIRLVKKVGSGPGYSENSDLNPSEVLDIGILPINTGFLEGRKDILSYICGRIRDPQPREGYFYLFFLALKKWPFIL